MPRCRRQRLHRRLSSRHADVVEAGLRPADPAPRRPRHLRPGRPPPPRLSSVCRSGDGSSQDFQVGCHSVQLRRRTATEHSTRLPADCLVADGRRAPRQEGTWCLSTGVERSAARQSLPSGDRPPVQGRYPQAVWYRGALPLAIRGDRPHPRRRRRARTTHRLSHRQRQVTHLPSARPDARRLDCGRFAAHCADAGSGRESVGKRHRGSDVHQRRHQRHCTCRAASTGNERGGSPALRGPGTAGRRFSRPPQPRPQWCRPAGHRRSTHGQ